MDESTEANSHSQTRTELHSQSQTRAYLQLWLIRFVVRQRTACIGIISPSPFVAYAERLLYRRKRGIPADAADVAGSKGAAAAAMRRPPLSMLPNTNTNTVTK